jgi:hypothetical protein
LIFKYGDIIYFNYILIRHFKNKKNKNTLKNLQLLIIKIIKYGSLLGCPNQGKKFRNKQKQYVCLGSLFNARMESKYGGHTYLIINRFAWGEKGYGIRSI